MWCAAGAPEAPSMFLHTLDHIIGDLLIKWKGQGHMWSASRVMLRSSAREYIQVSDFLFAGDIVLFCRSVASAQTVLQDLEAALVSAGLAINVLKSKWLRSPH